MQYRRTPNTFVQMIWDEAAVLCLYKPKKFLHKQPIQDDVKIYAGHIISNDSYGVVCLERITGSYIVYDLLFTLISLKAITVS